MCASSTSRSVRSATPISPPTRSPKALSQPAPSSPASWFPEQRVGDAAGVRTTSVVLRSAVDVPGSVEAGSVVEVWAAPLLERGRYDVPRILVADATVVSVTRDDSMIGGGSAALEVVIPRADVAATLAAMADESALSVVPTAGAAP